MPTLSEAEALAMVAVRGHCDDLDDWQLAHHRAATWEISSGVQDDRGIRCGQMIHLRVTHSAVSPAAVRFTFTLFRKTRIEQERIYQLELRIDSKAPKASHNRSHEHLGHCDSTGRRNGQVGALTLRLRTSVRGLISI